MSEKLKIKIAKLTMISILSIVIVVWAAGVAFPQDDYSVGGFIDEDGDGFNDLLPDSDGDGVPDGLDPDSDLAKPDSGYMHHYMHNFEEHHQMMWQNMNGDMMGEHMGHGEPGMYGPGDSTMHGGEGGHHGGNMGGGGMGPGGGHGPGGGMGPGGGGMEPGGGMGPNSVGNETEKPADKIDAVKDEKLPDKN